MSGKWRLIPVVLMGAVVVILAGLLGGKLWLQGRPATVVWAGLMALGLFLILAHLIDRYYRTKVDGYPAEDERSKKVLMYAAGRAYFVSIYIWLALMFLRDYLSQSQIFVIGMSGMFITFGISWLTLSRRENI